MVDYKIKSLDPARPVVVQLSKAVALDGKFNGRGDRNGKTWEYPLYIDASDITSFDIYPVAYGNADKLFQVADGVDQLNKWGAEKKPKFVCIEAGFGDKAYANESQQRAEIWMAINHGARGIIWFAHRWQMINGKNTQVSEKMPIDNKELAEGLTRNNAELKTMADVINSEGRPDLAQAKGLALDLGGRKYNGATYVFAVERGNQTGRASITIKGAANETIYVINEDRTLPLKDGSFTDSFDAFGTHLYKIVDNKK